MYKFTVLYYLRCTLELELYEYMNICIHKYSNSPIVQHFVFIEHFHICSKKLNLDGKTLQEFAERATIRSIEDGKDELCAELVTKYQVTPKLLLRFLAALEKL